MSRADYTLGAQAHTRRLVQTLGVDAVYEPVQESVYDPATRTVFDTIPDQILFRGVWAGPEEKQTRGVETTHGLFLVPGGEPTPLNFLPKVGDIFRTGVDTRYRIVEVTNPQIDAIMYGLVTERA